MAEFFEDIKLKRAPVPGLKEAKAALAMENAGDSEWPRSPGESGRSQGCIQTPPPRGTEAERGCVVLDQPQHRGRPSGISFIPTVTHGQAAAAGLRHSRAPGQCADALDTSQP